MSKAPLGHKRWYVVAVGYPPPEPLFTQVTKTINIGEPVPIPDEVTTRLIDKRVKEIAERLYTEIHRSFTVTLRKDQKREKTKRKMQKNSRRHNRGK